ncbi:winged helix-turn-helix domain-containing protein [Tateyamaria sp. SN3-11]|uniref:winged helix-turn-helix domain-containing protein n=1 Tax=Tateyamaria sp. SN3-11 TaxID=3092147 RepID=UPI0039EA6E03
MNVLFLGSDELFARVNRQVVGQAWSIFRAEDPEQLLDFEGTHSFQAALVGLCARKSDVKTAAQNAKMGLSVPVVIGLASQEQATGHTEWLRVGPDIVIPECGNDHLTKLQCDAILRIANGAVTETISCGGVVFNTSTGTFSVNGGDIYLPHKKHQFLELLFLKRGRTVSKEMVFNHLYGWDEPPEPKIVDVYVCQIRRMLREAGLKQDCIQTVWGQGYRVMDCGSFENRPAA